MKTNVSAAALGAGALIDRRRRIVPMPKPDRSRSEPDRFRLAWEPGRTALVGAGGAALVAWVTARNPAARPEHAAVVLRAVIVIGFAAAAVYAQRDRRHERMGQLLGYVTLFSCLWLLNGAAGGVAFTIGAVLAGAVPVVASYVMLAHPTGRLSSRADTIFLVVVGGLLVACWTFGFAATGQPLLHAPLMTCAPHCPESVLPSIGAGVRPEVGSATGVILAVKVAALTGWIALPLGTLFVLRRRARAASPPQRRSLLPVRAVGVLQVVLLGAFLVLAPWGVQAGEVVGAAYPATVAALGLAVIAGLAWDRLMMARAVADLVGESARHPDWNAQALVVGALRDPSAVIAYKRPNAPEYVDTSGATVATRASMPGRAVTWITRDDRRVAALVHDADLTADETFVEAIGAAALIHLEKAQLDAALKGSAKELEASRERLVESANAERRRIERDLHDSVQQQIVAVRIRLDLTAEALEEPGDDRAHRAEAGQQLEVLGRQLDDVLESLRSMARGIYPTVLHERGLRDAIRSSGRSAPIPVAVRAAGIARYPEDAEVAIYFCCLEALQNVAKHAGPDSGARVTLQERDGAITFEVRDQGAGFDSGSAPLGSGLLNMRDRMETVGGTLTVLSSVGGGTLVRGSIPVLRPRVAPAEPVAPAGAVPRA